MKHSAEFRAMCEPWRKESCEAGFRITNAVVFFEYANESDADEHLRQLQAKSDDSD